MIVHGEDCTVYIFLCERNGIWSWGDGFVGEGIHCANVRPEFKSPVPHKKLSMTLCLPLLQHCGGVERKPHWGLFIASLAPGSATDPV